MKIEINTITGEQYKGEFIRIDLAIWGSKRKEELTLRADLDNNQDLAIPISQVISIYPIELNNSPKT